MSLCYQIGNPAYDELTIDDPRMSSYCVNDMKTMVRVCFKYIGNRISTY